MALSLIPQLLLVVWVSGRPDLIEQYYSQGLYPVTARFFRFLYGWIPFSLGEFLYLILILWGLIYLVQNRKRIISNFRNFLRNVLVVLAVFYFTFNLLWGLNYYRKPISDQFDIRDSVTTAQVISLTEKLVVRTNALQREITGDSTTMVRMPYDGNEVFDMTVRQYGRLQSKYPFLAYPYTSLKTSNSNTLISYLGIGGYLNPFTNEAQVNGLTPVFRLPVVTAHEIGHQVGYAKENETSFIGYLVTLEHEDIHFQYSATAYGLSYCLSALRRTDEQKFEELYAQINFGVLENYRELREFNQRYANPFEPVFKSIFSTFLKANQQRDGVKSYGRIVELMVGYHEKFPIFKIE